MKPLNEKVKRKRVIIITKFNNKKGMYKKLGN